MSTSILGAMASQSFAASNDLSGRWEGAVELRGSGWPIRLSVEVDDGAMTCRLDLPELGMAWEPVGLVSQDDQGIEVELPFGLGAFSLVPTEDSVQASRQVGGGAVISLQLTRTNEPPPLLRDEVRFESNGVILAGTLVRPVGLGPWPAVVKIHGSVTGTRANWSYRRWADHLVRHRVAVLLYDRRGEGESTAGPPDVGFEALADDALAGVSFLAEHAKIDPDRIGLIAGSQGAWIAALAATRSNKVSFLILNGAPAVTPAEQEIQRVRYAMRAEGRSHQNIQDAVAHTWLYFFVVRSGDGWETLQASNKRAMNTDWGEYVDAPESSDQLQWWRDHHDFDMAAALENITVPVLAMYGERDIIVPPLENAAKLQHYLQDAGNSKVTVEVFAEADHALELRGMYMENGKWVWPRLSPEARQTLITWCQRNLNLGQTKPQRGIE